MFWTLLIWVVLGLAMMSAVWPMVVLVRAARNGYDLELYLSGMVSVLEEDDIEKEAKDGKFVRFILAVCHNVLWPYKLIWLTRDFVPRFDERYVDLVLEKLENEEHA